MGIVISTGIPTSSFFVTSGIVGFVSFAFTLGTFVKITWLNLQTLREPARAVHAQLSNLRAELREERGSLRAMRRWRRRCRREGKGGGELAELDRIALRTMGEGVKGLWRRFGVLEEGFLVEGVADGGGRRRRGGGSGESEGEESAHPAYRSYGPEWEKGRRRRGTGRGGGRGRPGRGRDDWEGEGESADDDDDDHDELHAAQRVRYAPLTLRRRFRWLWRKSEANELAQALERMQVRRIARQVGGLGMAVHDLGRGERELLDAVRRIDERVARVVGVRRVD